MSQKDWVLYKLPNQPDWFQMVGKSFRTHGYTPSKSEAEFWICPFEGAMRVLRAETYKTLATPQLPLVVADIRLGDWIPGNPPGPEFPQEPHEAESTVNGPDSHDGFIAYVETVKRNIKENNLKKAVTARRSLIESEKIPGISLLKEISEAYPSAFVYLFYSAEFGYWMGASPEILLELKGKIAKTVALAGTRIDATPWTEKEFEEQGIIVKYIEETLEIAGINKIMISDRTEMVAGPLKHLQTEIEFELNIPQENLDKSTLGEFYQIAFELSPTPAVAGYPKEKALDLINWIEGKNRELFCGFLGPVIPSEEKASLFVNLRCARWLGKSWRLHAGCGVNAGSIPQKEYEETEAKMQVIGRFL